MDERTATALSEVFAPWLVNIAFFLVLGAVTGAWPAAGAAAVGTGVAPMILIITLMRTRKVGDHHVTAREQRGGVLIGITLCVFVLIGVLALLSTPPLIWAGVWAALIFLVVFGAVTVVEPLMRSSTPHPRKIVRAGKLGMEMSGTIMRIHPVQGGKLYGSAQFNTPVRQTLPEQFPPLASTGRCCSQRATGKPAHSVHTRRVPTGD